MADAVTNKVVFGGYQNYTVHLTNISDGTGEAAVIKVDISTLSGPLTGIAPTAIKVKEISWSIQGFTSVRLLWDHTTDDAIATLAAGNGYMNLDGVGGLIDPRSSGGTGDILLTTAGATSGATYDITLVCQLKA